MIALSEPGILRALGVKDETVGSCQLVRCSGGRRQQRIVIVFGSGSPQTLKVRRRRHEQPGWRPRRHIRRRRVEKAVVTLENQKKGIECGIEADVRVRLEGDATLR